MSEFTQKDKQMIETEFEKLKIAARARCANDEEYAVVLKAFEFANGAHYGVRRRSGEPYIIHPIAVATIVVNEIGLGYKSIATALLHDVVEDTDYTVEDIQRLFGEKIASLVDGLTKIKSAMDNKVDDVQSIQAENFKRILLTLNDDVRVILIKLADRLHNMRTIEAMPERKQDKILSETMYIYIPLAHRLGLYSIKSEMENIWLKFREPGAYEEIVNKINDYTNRRGNSINEFVEPIHQILTSHNYEFKIIKRVKTPYSIWKKMQNKHIPFEEIYDLYAVRIIFKPKAGKSERQQCWDIYTLISEDYMSNTERIRDWTSRPKPNGYEALHCTLMSPKGGWIEIQIRSERMDAIAERGLAAHWLYKKDGVGKESDIENWLNMVQDVLNNPDANALTFLDEFHEGILTKEILVFTPRGESKRLPKGSTALDFAYFIHTQIGNKAIAAKVNLKLVPLSFKLRNGDQVEILTSESQTPQREWLKFVSTSKAKNYIYDALKSQTQDSVKKGQDILAEELNKLGVKSQSRVLQKLQDEFKIGTKDELYSKIAAGVVDLSNLDNILRRNRISKFVKYWKISFDKNKEYILEEHAADKTLSYKVSTCCNPIPGDPVIGFVDENNEVVIHKKSCPVALELASTQGSRIVNAKWTTHSILSFLARIEIKGIDRMGIVNELTQYITKELNVNFRKIFFEVHDGVFTGYIDVYIHNTSDLEDIIDKFSSVKGIESVKRVDIKDDNNSKPTQ